MKKDIRNRADIELMVNNFYNKVIEDDVLGNVFREKARANRAEHLTAMYNFWENIILFTGNYEGNPMNLHQHLHHITPLTNDHFTRWNQLFLGTVDELFVGEKANLAKHRAVSISRIIKDKLFDYQKMSRI